MNTRLTLVLGGLLLLAVTATGCSGSSYTSPTTPTPTPTPGGGADVTITITGMNGSQSFSPNPATAKAGQKVAWYNADNTTHTATADGGSFNTGNIAPGATSSPITVASLGSFNYHCQIHPTMVGTLTVTQ
jgi:plastocyanin